MTSVLSTMLTFLIAGSGGGAEAPASFLPTAPAIDGSAQWLVETLIRVTIDGAVVALPVWLVCRFVPSMPAAARAWLWWCVSLKMLLAAVAAPVLPASLLSLPALPAWTAAAATDVERWPGAPPAPAHDGALLASGASAPHTEAGFNAYPRAEARGLPRTPAVDNSWRGESTTAKARSWITGTLRAAFIIWGIGVALQLVLLVRDSRRLRSLVTRARIVDGELADLHEDLAKDLGLRTVPRLRESADISVPQVVGLVSPTVLLPMPASALLDDHERAMVLCHELAHVRRRDLLLGWTPAIVDRLLLWHPLARLAAREYALAREAACDALVLRTLDTEPRDYGRLLVRLGVSAPASGIAAAGASPTTRLLLRRLHMLQHASPVTSTKALWRPMLALAIVAVVPLRVVALRTAAAPATELAAPAVAVVAAGEPVAQSEPIVASAPAEATAGQERERREREERERERRHSRERSWVFLHDHDGNGSITMNGDTDDVAIARRLRGSSSKPFFYFRHDGRAYTIDDPQTLERVAAIFEPQEKLGMEQGELGGRQGELGGKQGELGMRQGALGSEQGELGAKQAELSMQMAEANAAMLHAAAERMAAKTSANNEALRRREAEAKARMREAEERMQELSRHHEELGHKQEALGRDQEALGRRQEALGAEQERLGKLQERAAQQAERELSELVERAIASGVAKAVR